jgi:uncharacterized Zn-finger protein
MSAASPTGAAGHHTDSSPDQPFVEVLLADMHGPGVVFCPNPKMKLWSNHPRVFIDVGTTGAGKCPYCGTVYRLKAGEKIGHGH